MDGASPGLPVREKPICTGKALPGGLFTGIPYDQLGAQPDCLVAIRLIFEQAHIVSDKGGIVTLQISLPAAVVAGQRYTQLEARLYFE